MTPEEIVADLNARNRSVLHDCADSAYLSREQVLVQLNRAAAARADKPEN